MPSPANSTSVSPSRQFALNAGSLWVVAVAKACLQLALIPVMARLLGPKEYGLYALALPTVSFFMTLTEGGLGASLSREPETSEALWSTAFWLLLGSGLTMAGCVTLVAVVLAHVSGEPRLFSIMALLSTSIVFLNISVIPDARLLRRGNLVYHSGADLISSLIGGVVAVYMASIGMGAVSLVGQYVSVWALRAFVLNFFAFKMPLLQFNFRLVREHLVVGGGVVFSKLVDSLGQSTENMIISRSFGPSALGTINLAYQMVRFLCSSVSNPVWASLYSHSLRGEDSRLYASHARLSRLLATILFPATFILSAASPQVLKFIFGPEWSASIPMIQVLLPLNTVGSVASLATAILLSKGRSGLLLAISAATAILRILLIFFASFISPFAIACVGSLAIAVSAVAVLYVFSRVSRLGVGFYVILWDITLPFIAALVGALTYIFIIRLVPDGVVETLASIVAAILCSGCAIILMDGRRLFSDIRQVQSALLAR